MSVRTHPWVGITEKLQNITINNVDGETTPFKSEKTMVVYSNNMIDQQSTSNVISELNKWSHSLEMRNQRKRMKK